MLYHKVSQIITKGHIEPVAKLLASLCALRYTFLFLFFVLLSFNTLAQVKLPQIFRDHMVLQRDMPLRIWGWAAPGEKVNVTLSTNLSTAVADKSGIWKLMFPAMTAGGPYELKVEGKNSIVLKDVLLGDVWICGGQSNMQWSIDATAFNETDTSFLKNASVRLFTVDLDMDYFPKDDIKGGNGWHRLSKDNIRYFSAVAYHSNRRNPLLICMDIET